MHSYSTKKQNNPCYFINKLLQKYVTDTSGNTIYFLGINAIFETEVTYALKNCSTFEFSNGTSNFYALFELVGSRNVCFNLNLYQVKRG